MRIDAYNQIAQLYGVSRTTKTAKRKTEREAAGKRAGFYRQRTATEGEQKAYFSGYNKQEQTERYTDAAWLRSVSYDCVNRRIVLMYSLPAAEIRADLQNADSSQPGIRA